jgi:hypothetical protein
MGIIGSIIALVLGILLFFWTSLVILKVLFAILAIAGGVWLVRNLTANRTDL